MTDRPAGAINGTAAQNSTDEGIVSLPDPTTLRNVGTEYPIETTFDAAAYYADDRYNGWYPLLEKFVDTMMDECDRYSSLHEDASKLYNKRYQIITISLIMIPFLSGAITIIPLGQTIKNIFQGILALVGVALGSFNKVMKFSERSHIHRIARDKFMKLNGTIAEQLLLPFEKRYNGVLFERWCRGSFHTMKEMAPYPERRRSKKITQIPLTEQQQPLQGQPVRPIVNEEGEAVPGEEHGIETPTDVNTSEDIIRLREYLQDRRGRATFRADPRG